MREAWMLVGLLAVGAALVASGCGGDDDEDTTTAALSKSEFVDQADAICAKGDKQINQAGADVFGGGQQPSEQEQEKFVTDTVIPRTQQQVDGIRALPAPEGDEDQISAILDSADAGLKRMESDPSLLTEGGGANPLAEASNLARNYGLKVCGQG